MSKIGIKTSPTKSITTDENADNEIDIQNVFLLLISNYHFIILLITPIYKLKLYKKIFHDRYLASLKNLLKKVSEY